MIRNRVYRDGKLEESDIDLECVSDRLDEDGTVVWVDLCVPDTAELAKLAEEVGLNPLAVEDAVRGRQRPKVDRYRTHLFITTYGIRYDPASGELSTSEIAMFVSRRYLLTVRRDPLFSLDDVLAAWDGSPDLAEAGVGFLLHGVLDVVVDGHYRAVQQLDDGVDDLEDLLFDDRPHGRDVQLRSYEMRKSLVLMRRLVAPMREVLGALLRDEMGLLSEQLRPYYLDVYDHVLRVTDWTDSLRDLVTTIFETHLTIQGNRLNETMKKVTSYAALVAVPTLVTGYFGMNVRIWPGDGTTLGGVIALALIFGLSLVLYVAFKRRDWL